MGKAQGSGATWGKPHHLGGSMETGALGGVLLEGGRGTRRPVCKARAPRVQLARSQPSTITGPRLFTLRSHPPTKRGAPIHTPTMNSNGFLTSAAPPPGESRFPQLCRSLGASASRGSPTLARLPEEPRPRFSAGYSHKSARRGQDSRRRSTRVQRPATVPPVEPPASEPAGASQASRWASSPPSPPATGAGAGGGALLRRALGPYRHHTAGSLRPTPG